MQVPIVKPFKSYRRHASVLAISSRIREVRESASQLDTFKKYLLMCVDLDLDSKLYGAALETQPITGTLRAVVIVGLLSGDAATPAQS